MLSNISYKRALIFSITGLSSLLLTAFLLIPCARLLIAFFLYTATLNSGVIPFPTMTAAIFLGKKLSPFLVAIVGTLGSAVSSVVIYSLMAKLSERKRFRRIGDSRLIRGGKRLASKAPFLSLVIFNAIPFPVDPSRLLAVLNRYSVIRYVIAISAGRFIRYFLLATVGKAFRVPNSVLIVLTVALIAVPFIIKRRSKDTRRIQDEEANKDSSGNFVDHSSNQYECICPGGSGEGKSALQTGRTAQAICCTDC